ncbi:signal recognition particle-docking protein FtsY [Lactobacillus sp. PSON]|uniref:signal recognition particle-docking protein FtsY n=1 Tax=Lactobacillus sp. PSON TaxID=3455454 RepID=UPI0040417997
MGLFDKIKKSLFGNKDEEKQEQHEQETSQEEVEEQSNEQESVSHDNEESTTESLEKTEDPEVEEKSDDSESTLDVDDNSSDLNQTENSEDKIEEESNSSDDTVLDKKQEQKAQDENQTEVTTEEESETDLDEKSNEDEEETSEEDQTKLYEKGLEKTNKGFGARLNAFFAQFRSVDEDFFDDLEELLIESDVGYETAEELTEQLRDEAKLQKAKTHDDLKRVIVEKLVDVYDQNGNSNDEKLIYHDDNNPNVYLFVGVNGAGKTTTIGKLAKRFKDEGKSVIMAAADTFRAGAVEQLVEWGKRVDVPVVTGAEKADPASVVYDATEKAIKENADILLVDTAGRLQNKKNLMNELEKIQRTIKKLLPEEPTETLLVLDGSTGQNALLQAKDFDKTTKLTGLVLTKLDGSSKGGVVLAIRNEMNLPVKLVGLGEKPEDLADFDAGNYAIGLFHGLV